MKKHLIYLEIFILLDSLYANIQHIKEGKFRAAVFEHELILPEACLYKVCSREDAIELMEINLEILEAKVIEAAENGAQIILLPEDAIHGYGHLNRQTLRQLIKKILFAQFSMFRPFLEYVPPVADGSNPCFEDGIDDAYISRR